MKKRTCLLLLLLLLCGCAKREKPEKTVIILEAAAPSPSASPTAMPAGWYGWWRMNHTSGDWAHMFGYYWDCLAELTWDDDGTGSLLVWDETFPRDYCLAQASLTERDGELLCQSGSFLDRELTKKDWKIGRSEDEEGLLLTIEGDYTAVGNGGFHYEIWLRPWGSLWPGPAERQPGQYSSWYLPLVEAGEPMPQELPK